MAAMLTLAEIEPILRQRLAELAAPVPSTKGMAPKDRADRLHAELLRRIKIARETKWI